MQGSVKALKRGVGQASHLHTSLQTLYDSRPYASIAGVQDQDLASDSGTLFEHLRYINNPEKQSLILAIYLIHCIGFLVVTLQKLPDCLDVAYKEACVLQMPRTPFIYRQHLRRQTRVS